MKKTLIYIEATAHKRLRWKALAEGLSMAELIRRAVAAYLKKESKKGRGR